jgi:SAM-dependent methyltransferase
MLRRVPQCAATAIGSANPEHDGAVIASPLRLRANLVQLQCLRAASVDHAVCLFSTLGMVRGRAHRRTVLQHARRILRPKGRLVLHAHNRWSSLRDPGGMAALWRSWWAARRNATADFGDRIYPYRGLPNMFLHSFGARELRKDLTAAGFHVAGWYPLTPRGDAELRCRRWLGGLRAGGFMVVAERTSHSGL